MTRQIWFVFEVHWFTTWWARWVYIIMFFFFQTRIRNKFCRSILTTIYNKHLLHVEMWRGIYASQLMWIYLNWRFWLLIHRNWITTQRTMWHGIAYRIRRTFGIVNLFHSISTIWANLNNITKLSSRSLSVYTKHISHLSSKFRVQQ